MSDYRVDAATKEEWAERAIRAEKAMASLKSDVRHLRGRIKDLEMDIKDLEMGLDAVRISPVSR